MTQTVKGKSRAEVEQLFDAVPRARDGQAASDRAGSARAGRAGRVRRRVALPDPREVREHALARAAGRAARATPPTARVSERSRTCAAVGDCPRASCSASTLADGTPVCLYNDRGTIGAVGDVCTHAEFPMSDGMLHADGTLECAWHGARFDCRTGAVRRGPAMSRCRVRDARRGGRVLVGPRRHPEPRMSTIPPRRFPAARRESGAALPRLGGDVAEAARRARRDARRTTSTTTRTRIAARTRSRRGRRSAITTRASASRDSSASSDADCLIFTRGTTESLNLVATAWGHANVQRGRRDRRHGARASRELRPLAAAGARARRAVPRLPADERPSRRPRRAARARRTAHEGRGVQPRVERARHGQPGGRDRGDRARGRRARRVRRRAGRAAPARRLRRARRGLLRVQRPQDVRADGDRRADRPPRASSRRCRPISSAAT